MAAVGLLPRRAVPPVAVVPLVRVMAVPLVRVAVVPLVRVAVVPLVRAMAVPLVRVAVVPLVRVAVVPLVRVAVVALVRVAVVALVRVAVVAADLLAEEAYFEMLPPFFPLAAGPYKRRHPRARWRRRLRCCLRFSGRRGLRFEGWIRPGSRRSWPGRQCTGFCGGRQPSRRQLP